MPRTLSSLLIALALLIGGLGFVLPTEVHAKQCPDGSVVLENVPCPPKVDPIRLKNYLDVGIKGKAADNSLSILIIRDIPNFLLSFIGLICLVFFLINGLRYLLGAGVTESTTEAKNGMLAAALGLVVTLTAFGVVTLINNFIKNAP